MQKNKTGKQAASYLWAAAIFIFGMAAFVRFVFPNADPPIHTCMGATYVDEGWMHQARNRALFGTWDIDNDYWHTMLVSTPANFLTYLAFKVFGVSTQSLRFLPALCGSFVPIVLALTAWRIWDKRAAAAALLLSGFSFALIIYSRVATIEVFLLTGLAFFLLLLCRFMKDYRYGFWLGLLASLCFAIKASAVLFIVPAFVAWLLATIAYAPDGRKWWSPLLRFEVLLCGFGFLAGLGLYWFFIIRGHYEEWYFLNHRLYGIGGERFNSSLQEIFKKYKALPSSAEGVIMICAPLAFLASVFSLGSISTGFRYLITRPRKSLNRYSDKVNLFLTLQVLLSIVFLCMIDISGRRVVMLLLPLTLMTAGLFSQAGKSHVHIADLKWWEAIICLVVTSPVLFFGVRSLHAFANRTYCALSGSAYWTTPLPATGPNFTNVLVIFALILLALVLIPAQIKFLLGKIKYAPAILCGIFLIVNVSFLVHYLSQRTYTVYAASRQMGQSLPENTVVLAGNALCWENRIIPVFSYPGIKYANRDPAKLGKWNAKYAIVSVNSVENLNRVPWWELAPQNIKKNMTSFWAQYWRVVAVYPIYDVGPWAFDPARARGYYLLVSR